MHTGASSSSTTAGASSGDRGARHRRAPAQRARRARRPRDRRGSDLSTTPQMRAAGAVLAVGDVAYALQPQRRSAASARRALGRRARARRGRRPRPRRRRGARWQEVPGFWSTIGEHTLKYAAWGDGYDAARLRRAPRTGRSRSGTPATAQLVGVLTHERDERLRARTRPDPQGSPPDTAPTRDSRPLAARCRPRPRLCAVVVIPARDEAERIDAACARCRPAGLTRSQFEVIVVLDGCRDETPRSWRVPLDAAVPAVHALELAYPEGVGRARTARHGPRLRAAAAARPRDGLIASTDADSDRRARLARLHSSAGHARRAGDRRADRARPRGGAALARTRSASASAARPPSACAPSSSRRTTGTRCRAPPVQRRVAGAHRRRLPRCGGLPVRAALEDEALERAARTRGIPIHRSRRSGCAPPRAPTAARRAGWRGTSRAPTGAPGAPTAPSEFPLERLLDAKRATIALVLPAREVAETIGPIAEQRRPAARTPGCSTRCSSSTRPRATAAPRSRPQAGVAVVQETSSSREFGPARARATRCGARLARARQRDRRVSPTPTPRTSASISSPACSGR